MRLRTCCLLLALALSAVSAHAQQRVVYVLTGQSNTDALATTPLVNLPCAWTGASPSNVSYHLTSASPATPQWPKGQQQLGGDLSWLVAAGKPPLQILGSRLASHHSSAQVQIVHAAWSGSALLWRNRQPGGEAWIDPVTPGNTQTLGRRMETVMQQLGLGPQDELHFIWGQGETDCGQGTSTLESEYSDWVRVLFGWLAQAAGVDQYSVHLVTLGGMYGATLSPTAANALRDAQYRLPSNPLTLPNQAADYAPVAHHFDLPHSTGDVYHLTSCGYATLAHRIADGIISPTLVPRVTDAGMSVDPNGLDIVIPTTATLSSLTGVPSPNAFFEVLVSGQPLPPSAFQARTSGSNLILRVLAGGLGPTTQIEVRHVPGTGYSTAWQTTPPVGGASLAMPLEPFVLRIP